MIAELADGTELEFPDETAPEVVQATVKRVIGAGSATAPSKMGDTIAGLPITRLAMGVASPVIAAGQLGANIGDKIVEATGGQPMVGKYINEKLADYDAAKQRGMKAAGNEGYDWMGLMGSMLPAAKIAKGVTAALPNMPIRAGAAAGATVAGAQPVVPTEEEGYFEQKGKQIGTGAAVGAAIPAVAKALDLARRGANATTPYFAKEGYKTLAQQHLRSNIGEENVPQVREALLKAQPRLPANAPVPGAQGPTLPASPMTAAEATSDLSAGSPVAAIQKIALETPGGPSKVGGDIAREAMAAQNVAKASRDAELVPQLKAILERADKAGKVVPKLEKVARAGERAAKVTLPKEVPSDALRTSVELNAPYQSPALKSTADIAKSSLSEAVQTRGQQARQAMEMLKQEGMQPLRVNTISSRIKKTLGDPEIRVYDTTNKTLDWVKNKLTENADMKGNVSGQDLWAIRKEVGTKIKAFADEEKNFDKRFTAKLLGGIQRDIDDAIEAAGGKGWKETMAEYARRSGIIEADIASKEMMYKPLQKTVVQRGGQIAEGTLPGGGGPPILRTGYTVAKYIPRLRAEIIEPKVDAYIADLIRHAPRLGEALKDVPPSKYQQVIEALAQRPELVGAAGAAAGRGGR